MNHETHERHWLTKHTKKTGTQRALSAQSTPEMRDRRRIAARGAKEHRKRKTL
jgi:hypothetical protein